MFPPELVDEVIAQAGRTEQRNRTLPARVMAYLVVGMALSSEGSYADVLSQLTDGLAWSSGWARTTPRRRSRRSSRPGRDWTLSPRPRCSRRSPTPLPTAAMSGSWLAGRRLVAGDGTCLDVADTVRNAEFFGRPGVSKGERAAFPSARIVALAECGTHAVFAAEIGRYSDSEATLTGQLVPRMGSGRLVLADRGCVSYACGAQQPRRVRTLLWRGADRQGRP